MKILLIGNAESIWIKRLADRVLIPIADFVSVQCDPDIDKKHLDFYKDKGVEVIGEYKLSKLIMKIPKLRVLYKNYKKKSALKKYKGCFDAIVVMYVTPEALSIAKQLKNEDTKIFGLFIGSDILRSTDSNTNKLLNIIKKCRPTIICESCQTQRAYQEKIGNALSDKAHIIYLGDEPIRYIDKWLAEGRQTCKRKFDIPENKTSVCIGYNASPAQQHIQVIEQIKTLEESVKERLCLVCPVAYGGSKEYLEKLESILEKTGIEYRLLERFLNADEVAALRVATDIFVNAQITDAISASLLECYYAGAKILNAVWLEYAEFSQWDLECMIFETFDRLPALIEKCLYVHGMNKNREVVPYYIAWETCKEKWKRLLEDKQND